MMTSSFPVRNGERHGASRQVFPALLRTQKFELVQTGPVDDDMDFVIDALVCLERGQQSNKVAEAGKIQLGQQQDVVCLRLRAA